MMLLLVVLLFLLLLRQLKAYQYDQALEQNIVLMVVSIIMKY